MPYKSEEDKKAHRLRYKERAVELNKEWEANNRERRNQTSREYYHRTKQSRSQNQPQKRLLAYSRARAKAKQLEHNLELSDIVIPEVCPVLGIPLEPRLIVGDKTTKALPNAPSLDRVDNSKGYVKGNVQVISFQANALKNSNTLETLELLIKYMSQCS